MPSATLDATAAAELRAAAFSVARHLEDPVRRFILRYIGEALEGASDAGICALCRRPFAYDREFFLAKGLVEPKRCFGCRVLMRGSCRIQRHTRRDDVKGTTTDAECGPASR